MVFFFLLEGRVILKAAQHSACFEIQEAGWLDKYSMHIAVPEWPWLPSLSALCTHSLISMHIHRVSNGCNGVSEERAEDREVGSSCGWGYMCWTEWNVKYWHLLHPTVTRWHNGTIPEIHFRTHFPKSLYSLAFSCTHCSTFHMVQVGAAQSTKGI